MLASRLALLAALSSLVVPACREADGSSQQVRLRPAPVTPAADAPKVEIDRGPHPADDRVDAQALADEKAAKEKKKGDRSDVEWIAKEFSSGAGQWRDTGVYVDGKPIGFLTWGELPIGLKASWLRDKVSADKAYGTNQPGWKWARKRYYKFTDYLRAMGVDIRKIKELHAYGPKQTETVIATGKDLLSPKANDFWFWFGANTSGKVIPHTPDNFARGRGGDKLSGLMIYIDKKPPTMVDGDGFYLDGELQTGVPYYGEPVRGGVRVYLDDKLATIIKRQELDPKKAIKGADGEMQWKLADFLTAHGVNLKHAAELWVIRGEKRSEHFSAAELAKLTFEASSQSKGGVLLGGDKVLANAIAIHTRKLKPSDMPLPEQDDE